MAVRQVQFVDDDQNQSTISRTVSGTTVVRNIQTTLSSTRTVNGIVLPVVGQNIVQNAIVSETPPANPYEGQVWIDIS